jgi:hypothetical protein
VDRTFSHSPHETVPAPINVLLETDCRSPSIAPDLHLRLQAPKRSLFFYAASVGFRCGAHRPYPACARRRTGCSAIPATRCRRWGRRTSKRWSTMVGRPSPQISTGDFQEALAAPESFSGGDLQADGRVAGRVMAAADDRAFRYGHPLNCTTVTRACGCLLCLHFVNHLHAAFYRSPRTLR